MDKVNERPQEGASNDIPLFYLEGDPAFHLIADRLSEKHKFHGLDIRESIVRQLKNPYSLRCMAEHCVKSVREQRPRGPYMLGGWCTYGILALEIAQLLREQGQQVALLVLLEALNPERLHRQTRLAQVMAGLQAEINLRLRGSKYRRSLRREQAKAYVSGRRACSLRSLRKGARQTVANSNETRLTRSEAIEVLCTASGNYLPRPYDSPVLLVRSRHSVFGFANDLSLGWGDSLGEEMEVCETEGNRYTIYVEPNAGGLVEQLSARLETAVQQWAQRTHGVRPSV